MKYHWKLRHWIRNKLNPPAVTIEHSGQATPRPQVHVSVWSLNGSQSVYTWDANDQGEASATLYGRGLARIMQRRLIDYRQPLEAPGDQSNG